MCFCVIVKADEQYELLVLNYSSLMFKACKSLKFSETNELFFLFQSFCAVLDGLWGSIKMIRAKCGRTI